MRLVTKKYLVALVVVMALAMASVASMPAPGMDKDGLSVLTPPGPAEPSAEVFRKLTRLIHTRHKIVKGENIRTIASGYGTDVRSLQSTNSNEFILPLSRGGYIRVHNGRGYLYEVTADGEKLNNIISRFKPDGLKFDDFKAIVVSSNSLPASAMLAPDKLPPYKFKKGDRLLLPGVFLNLDGYRLPLPYYSRTSSGFGMRYHPVLHRKIFHKGCDIPMPLGTPVYPSRSGTVVFAGWKEGYGNVVEMRHNDGSMTRYGHLSKVSVSTGETVQRSKSLLGNVGSTGMSTGPHLHFEIITPAGKSINPLSKIGKR